MHQFASLMCFIYPQIHPGAMHLDSVIRY